MISFESLDWRPIRRSNSCRVGCLLMLGLATACSSGGSSSSKASTAPGTILEHPDASSGTSKRFIVDANAGGNEQELKLVRTYWGRLVDVYDQSPEGVRTLQHKDFVIADEVRADAVDYELETNPITQATDLVILHHAGDSASGYEQALRDSQASLAPVYEVGLDGSGGNVLSMVPRNAAIVLQFNDLLDSERIGSDTVRVFTGSPPTVPFEPRIIADSNHGDVLTGPGGDRFRSTRIVIDTTISELDSFSQSTPLPVNGVGLPGSVNASSASLLLRLPTVEKASVGQPFVLRNLSGHALATSGNGPVDFGSPTLDVVRVARAGGSADVTGDPYNGFLRDELAPALLGRQLLILDEPSRPDPTGVDERDFILPRATFASPLCAQTPQVGDILRQAGVIASVRERPAERDHGQLVELKVRLLVGDPLLWPESALGAAEFLTAYDPERSDSRPECFVQMLPTPRGFPMEPTVGLDTETHFILRFSEAMDPASVTAFDSLTLTRDPVAQVSSDFVVGRVTQDPQLQSFTFVPDLPLAHQTGEAEAYYLNLSEGDRGPTDLAGNGLKISLPQVAMSIDPDATTRINGGRVTRFTSPDEDPPIGDDISGSFPEWTGQHLYDFTRELIRPRPVLRFEANADRTQPVPSLHSAFPQGVQTPLSRMGSRMQGVWRYCDVGYSLTDATKFNVDVEGIWWAPVGGQVVADHYPKFEMVLAHSLYLPDEYIDPGTGFPAHAFSGVKPSFAGNYLDPAIDPPKVVHDRSDGYTVDPEDKRTGATGVELMPYPMNRNKAFGERRYYTWRDTAILRRGAPNGVGADVEPLCRVLGQGTCGTMSAGEVESIGLPLLMEFRTWPFDESSGQNAFDISLAANSSSRPNFRAFSTGGLSTGGPVHVDPDNEPTAMGGFNPLTRASTAPVDNSFYVGALDLVTRVSRTYSLWFPATGTGITRPGFNPPVLEPQPDQLPHGTSIEIHFRGATAVSEAAMLENATTLDGYGDYYEDPGSEAGRDSANANPGLILLPGSEGWHADVSELEGATYYQVRVTFTSNTESGTTAELSALGLTWQNLD